jgi:hypothetical protein
MAPDELTELEADIKATAEDIATDAERVLQIESEKVRLRPDDPRLVELARESESLTAKMAVKAKAETALVDASAQEAVKPRRAG